MLTLSMSPSMIPPYPADLSPLMSGQPWVLCFSCLLWILSLAYLSLTLGSFSSMQMIFANTNLFFPPQTYYLFNKTSIQCSQNKKRMVISHNHSPYLYNYYLHQWNHPLSRKFLCSRFLVSLFLNWAPHSICL